jgi:hypothetical protein
MRNVVLAGRHLAPLEEHAQQMVHEAQMACVPPRGCENTTRMADTASLGVAC